VSGVVGRELVEDTIAADDDMNIGTSAGDKKISDS